MRGRAARARLSRACNEHLDVASRGDEATVESRRELEGRGRMWGGREGAIGAFGT